jgi:hypothetical protein
VHRPATLTLRVRPPSSGSRGPGRRPAAALAAVLVGSSIALAACQTMSPVQTDVPYQPADGININLGTVDARGLVLVTAAKGAAGVVVGSLINNGRDPVTVTFLTPEQAQSSSANGPSVQVSGSQQVPITGIQLENVPAAPGDMTNIVLQTKAGQAFANVPVLLPDGYYSTSTATTVPTTVTSTATTPAAGTSAAATTATAATSTGSTASATGNATTASATTAPTGG